LPTGLILGRGFRSRDTAPGAEPVVVLLARAWRTRFGADPAVVGRALVPEREREKAIRTAIGAGPWRLAAQLSTESALLTVAGGGLGLLAGALRHAHRRDVDLR
jgi:hypothetical protein